MDYLARVWDSRYFWVHLALADLRNRWRRSFFGILWSVLQPLGLTLLLALVFGRIFHSPLGDYAPYILSGMLVWDFISVSLLNGTSAFMHADAYIKQQSLPLAIYPLRVVLGNVMVMALASSALVAWVLATAPDRFGWCWLAAPLVFPLGALLAWPLATLAAYAGVRFRDLPHAMGLVLQACWFVSPVYFEEKVFRANGLGALVDLNPVYHLMEVARAPLLRGEWPAPIHLLWCLVTTLLLGLLAAAVGSRAERKVIYYL